MRDAESCTVFVTHVVATLSAADHLFVSALRMAPGPPIVISGDEYRALLEVGRTETFVASQTFTHLGRLPTPGTRTSG